MTVRSTVTRMLDIIGPIACLLVVALSAYDGNWNAALGWAIVCAYQSLHWVQS